MPLTLATGALNPWQPNQPVIAMSAAAMTLVFVAMLIFLFDRQPEARLMVKTIQIRLTSGQSKRRFVAQPTGLRIKAAVVNQTSLKPLHVLSMEPVPMNVIKPLPPSINWQRQIEVSVNSQAQRGLSLSSAALKNLHYTPLYEALNTPHEPAGMQNGGNYRDIDGNRIVKTGGKCLELKTIQFGPSPSDQVTLALMPPFTCPGDFKPTMADELSKWTDQQAIKHPPP
ncbi:MAG: hypothetical protein KGL13_07840 [Gammaproteobacteria bacterium]|nr:hypothetical protein [Gammaproteobacteria bacterium]MDE2346365.1 hypothetical protein [Gammaproteobacteria bacterium]